MSDVRITKAELVDRLAEKNAEIDRLRQGVRLDADAQAINACIRALDPLAENGGVSTYSRSPRPSVERVLTYLRHRYGIADATGERDALLRELEQSRTEVERLRDRLGAISQAVV